jgi:hypothetical protein
MCCGVRILYISHIFRHRRRSLFGPTGPRPGQLLAPIGRVYSWPAQRLRGGECTDRDSYTKTGNEISLDVIQCTGINLIEEAIYI